MKINAFLYERTIYKGMSAFIVYIDDKIKDHLCETDAHLNPCQRTASCETYL